MKTSYLLLLLPLALPAACADLLGVEPLSGSDASSPSTPEGGAEALTEDAGCMITWVGASGGAVPVGAVPNSVAGSSVEIYVCRVSSPVLGLIPGKLLPGYACYYGDGADAEVMASNYEVLVPQQCAPDALAWGPAPAGVTPVGAVLCGHSLDGGSLYSCRVGTTGANPGELGHVGWLTNHACVYSLSGASLSTSEFDILTAQ